MSSYFGLVLILGTLIYYIDCPFNVKLVLSIVLLLVFSSGDTKIEKFTNTSTDFDLEALNNLASMYKEGNLRVKNLDVEEAVNSNNINVSNELKVGKCVTMSGNPDAQDKIKVYRNGNEQPPYLFYNKSGDLGFVQGSVKDGGRLLVNGMNADVVNVENELAVGKNCKFFGKKNSQDKFQIYKDGDGRAPYLYYNKNGHLGHHGGGNDWYLQKQGGLHH